jgi:hypothetical protein
MRVNDHLDELHCLPVFDFPAAGAQGELPAAGAVAWRLSVEVYEADRPETFEQMWQRFLETVDPAGVRALVIGQWEEAYEEDSGRLIELITEARDRLTGLVAVFVGDMVSEECEISWIMQSDVTRLLEAFPGLEELGVRGGAQLVFPPVRHERLRTLAFETGGLPAQVVQGVVASELPALEYLELWLGVEEYGGDATVADLAPLLAGGRFPRLRHLGLQNSELQDEIAAAVAAAPVVAQLSSLSLSMGVLSDAGAEALLSGQPLTHLEQLDLHHHFLSDPMVKRVKEALEPSGVEVDLSGQEEPELWEEDEEWRYVAVSE